MFCKTNLLKNFGHFVKKTLDKLLFFGYKTSNHLLQRNYLRTYKTKYIMEKNVLASFVNLEANGRKLVVVKRIRRQPYWMGNPPIDFTNFTDPRIWAVIPGWQDEKGVITSLKTGKVIPVGRYDKVVEEGFGDAYDYEDGSRIIYTRGWKNGKYGLFFAERTCRDCECVHRKAFGEDLTADPLADTSRRW